MLIAFIVKDFSWTHTSMLSSNYTVMYMYEIFLFLQQEFIKYQWSSLLVFSIINKIFDNLSSLEIK